MEVIRGTKKTLFRKPLGVGLGNFDGLHIGHIALINALISECKLNNLHSMVYTFAKHPENILEKKIVTPLLITVEKKAELLNSLPLDYLFYEDFDESFSKMQPEDFVKEVLVNNFSIKLAMAGFDYTFGYMGQGDANLLIELGKKYNFRVIIIPPIKINDEVISSTLIREYLTKGDMEKTFYFLGRHYSITGVVESGHRIGSQLGFPTANIKPEEYLILPANGVYITKTLIDEKLYKSITNIGNAPTIKKNSTKVNIETYILDFNKDIYKNNIEVFFIKKIRDEKKFNSKEELIQQINSDVLKVKNY